MMPPFPVPSIPGPRLLAAVLACVALVAPGPQARAQSGVLSPGDGIATQFSGLRRAPDGTPLPEPGGVTVRAVGLANPGFPADGSVWSAAPMMVSLTAADTGQVFGLAFDDGEPASAYLAATSAYGLYRTPSGDGWADGMWGPGGGPGTVWKLDGANGYRPSPFAEIGGPGGNGGAGLGAVAFDPWNRQLFVSDLESGLIHRLDLETGETLQEFDHGLDGRSYFLDVPSGQYLVLDVVPQDTAAAPSLNDCTDAAGAAADFAATPECWNYADFRRRVWGLGVQRDLVTDSVRLYYAVWGGAGFGSEAWATAGDDARTTVWSVRLDGNGGFDLTDVRRELVVPPLVPEAEGAEQAESPPVTGIAFSSDGGMVLAERGRPQPDFGASPPRLVAPGSARVLHYVRGEEGIWESDGRYDVGFPERGPDAPPHIRANASGGVAFGHGYTDDGASDPAAVDAFVWMSGDPLCAPGAPCIDRQSGQASVEGPVGGLQGTPASALTDLVASAALQPYPASGGPVTRPDGPLASYLVASGGTGSLGGAMGGVAVYRGAPPTQVVEIIEEPAAAPPPEAAGALAPPLPDLAVAKSGIGSCRPGEDCLFEISVANHGPVDYFGPILLTDTIGAPGVSLTGAGPEPWVCHPADGNVYCLHPSTTLAPGAELRLSIALSPGPGHREPRLDNCAAVTWLGRQGRDRIRAVQAELAKRGFDPGTVDGLMGPRTAAAIRAAEGAAGMPATGAIGPGLIEGLFGPGANQDGDASPANDQDCGRVLVDVPPPPAHLVQASSFHRKFDSVNHDPRTSGSIAVHDPNLSYFHRTWQSSLHDTVVSEPIPLHRVALSEFHLSWGSAFHDSVYTQLVPVHSVGLSGFHSTHRSIMHDFHTSTLLPTHRGIYSNFHRTWESARHDGWVTRLVPVHGVQLSAFHRRYSSSAHDRTVTGLRPIHNWSVSNVHHTFTSDRHDSLTTRQRPIHVPAVSSFHNRSPSSIHDLTTTRTQPRHYDNVSSFHRSYVSGQHDQFTTRVRPIHAPDLSSFHRRSASSAHDPRTSRPLPIHTSPLSSFHRSHESNLHNPASSQTRPIHNPGVSAFHRTGQSGLHDPSTSRASPIHSPSISNFHGRNQSDVHNRNTSNAQSPSHRPQVSSFHRNGQSSLHDPATSNARPPVHNPTASNATTRPTPPPAHNQTVSRARPTPPIHNEEISSATTRPTPPPAHNQTISRARPTPPIHNPTVSNATTQPTPPPAHNQNVSRARPTPPIHNPEVSNATTRPTPPPAHSQAASRATQPPVHNPTVSNATTRPTPPPAHNQNVSRARPTPPVHNPTVSNATTRPTPPPAHSQSVSRASQPRQPSHSPSISNATVRPTPQVPAHNQTVSRAAQPRQPSVPTHNPNVSAAQQQPRVQQPRVQQPRVQQPRTPPPAQQSPRQAHDPRVSQAMQTQQSPIRPQRQDRN